MLRYYDKRIKRPFDRNRKWYDYFLETTEFERKEKQLKIWNQRIEGLKESLVKFKVHLQPYSYNANVHNISYCICIKKPWLFDSSYIISTI